MGLTATTWLSRGGRTHRRQGRAQPSHADDVAVRDGGRGRGADTLIMSVELVRLNVPRSVPDAIPPSGVNVLAAAVRSEAEPVVLAERLGGPQSLEALAEQKRRRDERPEAQSRPGQPAVEPVARDARDKPDGANSARHSDGGGRASQGSFRLGAEAPCWAGLSRNAGVRVTLEIEVNERGELAEPPKVLRTAGTRITETRLRTEAIAIESVKRRPSKGRAHSNSGKFKIDVTIPRKVSSLAPELQ